MWILKPSAAYCGRGIFLHRVAGPTGVLDPNGDVLTDTIREHKGVACRYINPPFLLDGLKSDIRLYVLVTSFHPLCVYLYEEGLVRFATEPYDMTSLDRRCMHLTNYSLNKHNKNFVKNTNEHDDGAGSKWSLTAFKRRLRAELGEARTEELWQQVNDLVVKAVIAAEPTVVDAMKAYIPAAQRGEPNRQCFQATVPTTWREEGVGRRRRVRVRRTPVQVFGFDVMLDSDAKPWLLEASAAAEIYPRCSTAML